MKTKNLVLASSFFLAIGLLAGCQPAGHTHNYGELVKKVDATCEVAGHQAYYHCAECDKYFDEAKNEKTLQELAINALGHDWVKVTGKTSTCTEDGWRDYYDCSRCDKYAEDNKGSNSFTDLAAWKVGSGKLAKHVESLTLVESQPSTCLADGYKAYYVCGECQTAYTDATGATKIADLDAWKAGEGKIAKHVDELTKVNGVAGSCLADGYKDAYKCDVCGMFYEDAAAETLIGDETAYNAWKVAGGKIGKHVESLTLMDGQAATCLADGYEAYYVCDECQTAYTDAAGANKIDDLDAWKVGDGKIAKHVDELTKVDGVAASCLADGYKDAYKCDVCGMYYEDTAAQTLIGNEEAYNAWKVAGGKLEKHVDELSLVDGVEPTCIVDGYKDAYKCDECGTYFEDSAAQTLIGNEEAYNEWKVAGGKLEAHSDSLSLVNGSEPDCYTAGYKDAYKCDECGKYFEDEDGEELIGDETAYNTWISTGEGYLAPAHTMVEHEAVAPTGFNDGNSYYCECLGECEGYYADKEGTTPIEEDSWVVPALKTITFDDAEQITNNTSKEGDAISLDKYNYGGAWEEAIITLNAAAGDLYPGYMVFDGLKGVSSMTIAGTGTVRIRTATTAWSWLYIYNLNLSSDPITLNLDSNVVNSVMIEHANGEWAALVNSVSFVTTLTPGEGSIDTSLLKGATCYSAVYNSYGYKTSAISKNGEESIIFGTYREGQDWTQTYWKLAEPVEIGDGAINFDVKCLKGHPQFSFVISDSAGVPISQEFAFDVVSGEWTDISYNPADHIKGEKVTSFQYFIFTAFTDASASQHEFAVDNFRIGRPVDVRHFDAIGGWGFQALANNQKLPLAGIKDHAVAIDFKPTMENTNFQLTYMADGETHFLSCHNTITVTNGVPTSTIGQVVEANRGTGWYTLMVSEKNLTRSYRYSDTNIGVIYLNWSGETAPGGVNIDFGSVRLVDDIAPNRNVQRFEKTEGVAIDAIGFGSNDFIDVPTLGTFRSNENNELLLAVKLEGEVGNIVTMGFASQGGSTYGELVLTITEDGVSSNFGRVEEAIGGDGWYNVIIKPTDVPWQTELYTDDGGLTASVFWIGGRDTTVSAISFDTNSLRVAVAQ